MLELHRPELSELWFRARFLSDEATMSYNRDWGGTIPFPESEWEEWYAHWVSPTDGLRFYRYLKDRERGEFVGEIAFHYDSAQALWLADVIVEAKSRGRGFGAEGLRLLCDAAAARGIDVLYDDIAADNPAIGLFLKAGFVEVSRSEKTILLKKDLTGKQVRE